jgi:mRNA interferase MazF
MKRGDLVTVSAPGDYAKPSPAVVVQSDLLTRSGLGSIIVCLISTFLEEVPAFRLDIVPTPDNGLKVPSQIMVDKLLTVPATKIGKTIGRLDDETSVYDLTVPWHSLSVWRIKQQLGGFVAAITVEGPFVATRN